MGVFLNPFRHDELHFIYFAKQNSIEGFYRVFMTAINFLVHLIPFETLWILKLINLSLAIILMFVVYQVLDYIIKFKFNNNLWKLLISLLFVSVLTYFRGFEIRPEGTGNTIALFTYLILLKFYNKNVSFKDDYIWVGLFLVLILFLPFWSVRYSPIAIFLYIMFLIRFKELNDWIHLVIILLVTLLIVIFFIDEFEFMATFNSAVSEFKSIEFSLIQKFSYGEWWLSFISKIIILSIIFIFCFFKFYKSNFDVKKSIIILFPSTIICSFYLFLYLFDKRPFEYVRSIEWVCLFISLTWLFLMTEFKFITFPFIFSGILLLTPIESQLKLIRRFNTFERLKNYQNLNIENLSTIAPNKLIEVMVLNRNIPEQLYSRKIFSKKFPDSYYFVHNFENHPICLKLGGYETAFFVLLDQSKIIHRYDKYLFFSFPENHKSTGLSYSYEKDYYLFNNVWIRKVIQ